MKKLLLSLLVSITSIFSLGIASSAKSLSFYQTIIRDHDHFVYSVSGKEEKHTRDVPQYSNRIVKNHRVGLTKVTYFNDNHILFNTNEKRLLNQRDNHHQLRIFDSKMHIDVENITTTRHLSAAGMYYIKGDPRDKAIVLSLMSKYVGDTIKQENPSLLSYLASDQYTLALVFLLSLLIFIVYCHYL